MSGYLSKVRRLLASALVIGICAQPALAQDRVGARLGAASNFGQATSDRMMQAAIALGVRDFRDAVYWQSVEQAGGAYDFAGPRVVYPDTIGAFGARMSLTVNNPHERYDEGNTPYSAEAVGAFARFAATAAQRFAAVDAVEVGNEMNSQRFASGPGWDGTLEERAAAYVALLAETSTHVRGLEKPMRILGGAAESIPLAWFDALFEQGAAKFVDAWVVHPYSVAPEDLPAMIDLLRLRPEAREVPLEITEFGWRSGQEAPAYLIKSHCQMSLSGVTRAVWYPLNPRGDGYAPLIGEDFEPTDVGKTFALIQQYFVGQSVAPVSDDPLVFGCRYGENAMVLWGANRDVVIRDPNIRAVLPNGAEWGGEKITLDEDTPVILVSAEGALGEEVQLGQSPVLADTRFQFAFDPAQRGSNFSWHVRKGGAERPMQLRRGQEKNGVPWTPYLGTDLDGLTRAGPGWVLPGLHGDAPLDVMVRHVSPKARDVIVQVDISPADRSTDGVTLDVILNGDVLIHEVVTSAQEFNLGPIAVGKADQVDVIVGPGETSQGDVTQLRVRMYRTTR
ncbi:hypothetical protein [Shimia abyssi]|uniref:Glycosyl hydrolase n=1 Tax=Shimia abyssi TaxID=1662395 RepID=A0A2P8F9R6_9RHOB|nr:hypothetical protein [Shimia abyssi]PSL18463.1 hypothetical protein CLV88_11040 [Shimia abyssi]